ncbi:MAG: hypothetical protein N3D10_04220 [Candidatus Micrarchaeota archaeon]|nr:hypothetical protein [Candidatus Micrarchaeota archaeon]
MFYLIFFQTKAEEQNIGLIKREQEKKFIEQNTSQEAIKIYKECQEGQEQECFVENNCKGKKICIEGIWTKCYQTKICVPGKKILCSLDGCSFGYKTCNSCGDGWSECELS